MNYQKHYDLLVNRGKTRTLPEGTYVERHHIIPRCMDGSNDKTNLVKLTPEEHYLAHLLLVKIYPDNNKLIYAAHRMCSSPYSSRPNNKIYAWLRKAHALAISIQNKGCKSYTRSDETKAKLSAANKGRLVSKTTRAKISAIHKGVPKSSEHNRKNSEANKERVVSEETRHKLRIVATGKPVSDETKMKLSVLGKGKIRSEESKAKMSAAKKAYWARKREEANLINISKQEQVWPEHSEIY